jgi:hypothetical protein
VRLLLLIPIFLINTWYISAQSPNKMSFQAVIRDASGELVANQSVGLRMSILQGSVSGSSVYTETHSPTTNSSGLISIEIGGGTTTDDFSSIDWSNGPYYLKREVDPAGGSNYLISGTSQLMSVPYAMYATIADTILNAPDTSSTNEIQTISKVDRTVTLSNDGGTFRDSILTEAQVDAYTNNNGYLTSEVDGSITNEIQVLSISNDTIYLSGGGFAKLPSGFDGDYNNLTNKPTIPSNTSQLTNDAGFLTSEVDGSITNEIQVLSISNDTIYLSGGGFAKLPSVTSPILSVSTSGDTLYLSGGNYIIVPGISAANTNALTFNKTYGGSSYDYVTSIQQTDDGGFIVAGFTGSSNNGDVTDSNKGNSDFWILKLNNDGTKAWDKSYGGSGNDYATSIQQTDDGGFIVAGYTNSSNNGDVTDSNNGGTDSWILKLNPDGTKVWDKTYGGSSFDSANSIQQTSDGGFIVAGRTNSSNNGDVTDSNNGGYDFWILKLNSDGTKAWDKSYGGSGNDFAFSVQQTSDGGFIVAGYTDSSDGDITDGNIGGNDIWILKLNNDGTKAWDKSYGGSGYDEAKSIQQTSDGGFIVAGYTDSSDGYITDGNNGAYDFWILKLNSDGTKEWAKTYGGSGYDFAYSVQQTDDRGFIVAGYTDSSNNGDVTDSNKGNSDFWILKLNSYGTKAWDKSYGGSGIEYAFSVQQTSDGGFIVAGYTDSSDGDINDGNNGAIDFWILKLNKDGYVSY